jgi:hypothetical protein
MAICGKCGSDNQAYSPVCRTCAHPLRDAIDPPNYGNTYNTTPEAPALKPAKKVCSRCQMANEPNWAFCMNCGAPFSSAMPASSYPPEIDDTFKPTAIEAIKPTNSVPSIPTPGAQPISVQSGIVCPICYRSNPESLENCQYCRSPLGNTLSLGSTNVQPEQKPKLRLLHDSGVSELYDITGNEIVIGRNNADIKFPLDGYMSGRHARIVRRGDHFSLIDERSRNGTFIRISNEMELKQGDIILVGKQLFRFEE